MAALKKFFSWVGGLVGNPGAAKLLIALFIILFIGVARCARGDELHLEFGSTILHGYGPYLGFYYRWERPHNVDLESGLQLWGRTRYEQYDIPNNWSPYAMVSVRADRFRIGIGVAYLQLADSLDGSHTNIALKMGFQASDRWAVDIRHLSNAGTTPRNVGRNAVLADWRLR